MRSGVAMGLGALAVMATACGEDPVRDVPTGAGAANQGGNDGGGGAGGEGAGSSTGGQGGSGGTAPDYHVCDNPPATYPEGPYGRMVGDTVTPLELEGWVNPDASDLANTSPFGAFTLEDVRHAGSPHVLLHLAATW